MRHHGKEEKGRSHVKVCRLGRLGIVMASVQLVVSVWGIACLGASDLQGEDSLCATLFEEYVVQGVKVGDPDVEAVCQIIASRGRMNGFWRHVLAELRKDKERTEKAAVKILGKMLEADARAREALKLVRERKDERAAFIAVCLGDEVIEELVSRARKVDRSRLPEYVIAIVRSGREEGKDVLFQVLQRRGRASTGEFYSAVGLSQLGDPVGVEWLIEHCEDRETSVFIAWPEGTLSRKMDACCQAALKQISGRSEVRTASEWQKWWNSVRENFRPVGRVRIVSIL